MRERGGEGGRDGERERERERERAKQLPYYHINHCIEMYRNTFIYSSNYPEAGINAFTMGEHPLKSSHR